MIYIEGAKTQFCVDKENDSTDGIQVRGFVFVKEQMVLHGIRYNGTSKMATISCIYCGIVKFNRG